VEPLLGADAEITRVMPTANTRSAHDVLAALLRVLARYASDVVLIGGWVHAL
jgi:hypothetical protein